MDIADVKNQLSGDEKVLESVFKLETIYKKYKVIIWAVMIGLVGLFVGKSVMQSMHETRLAEANSAFMTLQKNPSDASALETLKEKNLALFELLTYANANKAKDTKVLTALKSSKNRVIADASEYVSAALQNKKSDSRLYKEMAILEDAYLSIKSGDIKAAKSKLGMIDKRSQLHTLSSLLSHSTLKAK